jgi:hypothetical protein
MITTRRYDLDWLRIIAFGILIYFHAAIFFIPGGIPMIQNGETSAGLEIFVSVSHQFRLALLFFISGVGVAFAKKRRSDQAFIAERSKRLLIPLAVGILFIVPPMVYTEKLFLGAFTGSFAEFYPLFFTEGVYPTGNLSWHHFWFIVYLYLFCMLGLKVFSWLTVNKNMALNNLAEWGEGYGIYRFIIPLVIVEISLRALFPGFRDLIHDWASFFHWFLIFLAGFVVANYERLLDTACRLRYVSLIGAIFMTCALYYLFGGTELHADLSDEFIIPKYLSYCFIRMTMVWCSILACLGFAAKYLRFASSLLSYINEAVYPLFILHLTVITLLGYWVVELDWDLWLKYGFITSATIGLVLVFYHFMIRPFNLMRLLFGVKEKAKADTTKLNASAGIDEPWLKQEL